jgi:hypothetical protein
MNEDIHGFSTLQPVSNSPENSPTHDRQNLNSSRPPTRQPAKVDTKHRTSVESIKDLKSGVK